MPGDFPNTPATDLPAGATIKPGETSLQAAARRSHERKRRDSASSGDSEPSHEGSSPTVRFSQEEPRRDSQNFQNSTGSAETPHPRRRSSLSERWHEFKRHLP